MIRCIINILLFEAHFEKQQPSLTLHSELDYSRHWRLCGMIYNLNTCIMIFNADEVYSNQ